MNDTPIYREALIEAKRRTKRNSPERRRLELMDIQTEPEPGPPSGPALHFTPPAVAVNHGDSPGTLVRDLQKMEML